MNAAAGEGVLEDLEDSPKPLGGILGFEEGVPVAEVAFMCQLIGRLLHAMGEI